MGLKNLFKNLFKKEKKQEKPVPCITIPNYVRKIEEKYNLTLEDDYKELIKDGITGRGIIKQTLITNIKMTKR